MKATANLKRTLSLTGALAAALLLSAPIAFGAELTHDEYVAKVEPICKANTQANEKILKGARSAVKSGQYDKAAGQFSRAATALEKTVKQLQATPQPSEDAATLKTWLRYVSGEVTLLRKGADALKAHNKSQAQAEVVRLTHNANQANATVGSFGFTYCRFSPSKFT